MGETIRELVKDGMLEPLQKTELPEGKEVLVTIVGVSEEPDDEAFLSSAGAWKDLIDADALIEKIYDNRLIATRGVPKL
jgi:predicted DNA-binding antitoxin AbrB/MazE fold protein